MIDRLSRLDLISPALDSSLRWKDIVAGGEPKWSLSSPAAIPAEPLRTSSLNTSKRDSCAKAPRALAASCDFIFPILSKDVEKVNRCQSLPSPQRQLHRIPLQNNLSYPMAIKRRGIAGWQRVVNRWQDFSGSTGAAAVICHRAWESQDRLRGADMK